MFNKYIYQWYARYAFLVLAIGVFKVFGFNGIGFLIFDCEYSDYSNP